MVWFVFLFVATLVASQLLIPKPKLEDARASTLGDLNLPIVDASRPVPIIYGTVKLSGPNVVFAGGLRTQPIKEKVKNGGIFSGYKNVTLGFNYRIGLQFSLCRGQIEPDLFQIWIGDKLAYHGDVPVDGVNLFIRKFFGDPLAGGAGGLSGPVRAYLGTDDQPANAYLQSLLESVDRTPRYVGTAHCVFEGGYHGNSNYLEPWAFVVARLPNPIGLSQAWVSTGDKIPVLDDVLNLYSDSQEDPRRIHRSANPANAIYELLTSREFGKGLPADRIDIANFRDIGEVLRREGNGISMVIDRTTEIDVVIDEILRQIDGYKVDDPVSGKIRLKLARGDYDIGDLTEISKDENIAAIERFGRVTLSGTANQVRVDFVSCEKWAADQEIEHDMANAMMQGALDVSSGVNVAGKYRYPYVMSRRLAKAIAKRELRKTAAPLVRCTARCTRDLWATLPGDVLALTDAERGLDHMPMRVLGVTHEAPGDDHVVLDLVQDFFAFEVEDSSREDEWTEDSTLLPFERGLIEECPRAIARRAIEFGDVAPGALLYVAAARRSRETGIEVRYRETGSGDPFVEHGQVPGHMVVATLKNTLAVTPIPTSSITVTCASAEDQAAVIAAFPVLDPADAGINLRNLIVITAETASPSTPFSNIAQGEFALVAGGASAGSGLDVVLSDVYRGVFDTAQVAGGGAMFHSYSGGFAQVFLLLNAGTSDGFITVPGGSLDLDVKLVPYSAAYNSVEESISELQFTLYRRTNAPYNPGSLSLNGNAQDQVDVSLEGAGSGDSLGIRVQFVRRDYRTSDEVQALTVDAATLFPDFPARNATTQTVLLQKPGVLPTTFATQAGAGNDFTFTRNDILLAHAGAVPAEIIARVRTTHVVEGVSINAHSFTGWKFTTDSALDGQFVFGALDQNAVSAAYTATTTNTYNFNLFSNMTGGDIERRINGGIWVPFLLSGTSSGSVALSAGDTIELRHNSASVGLKKFLQMSRASVDLGFAVIFKS